MKRVKTLFKSILYVLIFLIVNFGVITIFTLIFKLSNNLEINTPQYVEKLAKFLNDYKILIATSAGVLLFPLIRKLYLAKNIFILYFNWCKLCDNVKYSFI